MSVRSWNALTIPERKKIIKYWRDLPGNHGADITGLTNWENDRIRQFMEDNYINIYDYFLEIYQDARDVEQTRLIDLRESKRKAESKKISPRERVMFEIIEMSQELGKHKECPCCMEQITKKNVHVSNCYHMHCKKCASKLKKCSMCREDI
jgi:hypothetical protein